MLTPAERQLIRRVADAIVETVEEICAAGDDGAPVSAIYLALQSFAPNMTATTFQQLIDALVAAGRIRHDEHAHLLRPIRN